MEETTTMTSLKTISKRPLLTVALAALVAGGGLYAVGRSHPSEAATAPAAPPAVEVTVQTLSPKKVQVWSEFSGRLHAVDQAEIRPEVNGRITEVRFHDGQNVKQGDILLVIDPRPYEAAVSRAEANLASAKTNADFARIEQQRAAGMIKTEAIAQRIYDERNNNLRVAEAAVKAAEADLKTAQVDLEHAYVRAPISGRTSRAELTVGNIVQSGPSAPVLTSVVSHQAIYADFEVDEQTYVDTIRQAAGSPEQEHKVPVQLTLEGDKSHVYQGTIDSFDNRLDVASGTIRARAKFENTDGALVPGMFVSVALASPVEHEEILVPEKAVGFDQSKKFVLVVDKDNKVEYRAVELGPQVAASRVALKGVQAGDKVIVDGIQHVRPSAVVAPHEAAQTAAN
jgi:multidrug efflux system membrane fusion protein